MPEGEGEPSAAQACGSYVQEASRTLPRLSLSLQPSSSSDYPLN
jgi:hypothetical protein